METFKIFRTEYDTRVHTIRYEDLLEDLVGETTTLLNFKFVLEISNGKRQEHGN